MNKGEINLKRKILFMILIIGLLSSCTAHKEISQKQEVMKNKSTIEEEKEVKNNQIINESNKSSKDAEPIQAMQNEENTNDEVDWFEGAINGNLKIYMKLVVENDKVSGIYYYDKYKKNIELSGDISNNYFTAYEKDLNGIIEGVFISDELIEGVWSDADNTYPLYLVKKGSNISIPKDPDNSLKKWEGNWKGVKSNCYVSSDLTIYPLFDNLIKFELTAFNGTHIGTFSELALFNDNNAIYIGENDITGEGDIEFRFSLDNEDNIKLDTNDYSYGCGQGVAFDSVYTKKTLNISAPSAKEAGLVYSDQQEAIFKELTGDHYDEFIQYAQFYTDEEDLDEIGAKVRTFHLRGYSNAAIVMINEKDNAIIAAIDGGDAVYYFTNNKIYTNPPKTIEKWYKGKNGLEMVKIVK